MKHLIDKLRSNRRLDAEEYKALLLCRDTELAAYLQELAREEALARRGIAQVYLPMPGSCVVSARLSIARRTA